MALAWDGAQPARKGRSGAGRPPFRRTVAATGCSLVQLPQRWVIDDVKRGSCHRARRERVWAGRPRAHIFGSLIGLCVHIICQVSLLLFQKRTFRTLTPVMGLVGSPWIIICKPRFRSMILSKVMFRKVGVAQALLVTLGIAQGQSCGLRKSFLGGSRGPFPLAWPTNCS